ncbi:MAG TPA: hypothetical protein PKA21_03030 [Kiritimatiellia bacterium]|nr:hypothetical protein [Kiritimatiellia bacterium]HMP96517.1 hypothetical protein [Kiritimatiellia bacterium]
MNAQHPDSVDNILLITPEMYDMIIENDRIDMDFDLECRRHLVLLKTSEADDACLAEFEQCVDAMMHSLVEDPNLNAALQEYYDECTGLADAARRYCLNGDPDEMETLFRHVTDQSASEVKGYTA